MERKLVRSSFPALSVMAIGLLIGLASAALAEDHHQGPCSNATLNGSYGYYRTGTAFFDDGTEGPLAAVGTATYDGYGRTHGIESLNRHGEWDPDHDRTGRYQVNTDCRGMLMDDDGVEFARIVVVNGGDVIYLVGENNPWYIVQTRIREK